MKKIFNARILALILITAVVLVPILSQTVASASADSYKNYDLSNPSSSSNTVIDAEYFVNLLGGSGVVSDVEREYLRDVYSYISVKYDEPTADNITISALNDTVTVIAETYSYKTSGGITVFWNPVSVTVDGTDATANFTVNGGEYVASIAGVSITDHSKVVVKYVMDRSFEIDKDDLNSAFNYTFNEAEKIKADYIAAENSYNELKKVYDEKLDEYEKWLNRTEEEKAAEWAAYDKYLDDLAIYQEKLVSYNEYLKQLKEYQDQVDAYNAYLVARDEYNYFSNYKKLYPSLLSEYNVKTEEYRKYNEKINAIKAHLAVFDAGLFQSVTSLERDLYNCIMGDTVSSVISRENEIVAAVPSAKDAIKDSGDAVEVLKTLLGYYANIKYTAESAAEIPAREAAENAAKNRTFASDEEKQAYIDEYVSEYKELYVCAQEYAFYTANYATIRDNIILLAQTLYDLYRYDFIRTGIHTGVEGSGGKTDKYVIMVSQLILFANVMSDSPVYSYPGSKHAKIILDKSTTIEYLSGELLPYKKVTKTVLQILENDEYVKDTNSATPLGYECPLYMEEPIPPVHPDDMTPVPKPAAVQKPGFAPTPVEEPIEPTEVVNPDLYVVEEPVAPQKPAILDDAHSKSVIAALNSGAIVKRNTLETNYTYTPTVNLTKNIVNDENVTITFYESDNTTVCSKVIAPLYSSVSFEGATPTKPSTDTEDYTFKGWVDAAGNAVNLNLVTKDIALYPAYNVTEFVIVKFFDTDGVTQLFSDRVKKGSAVVYNGVIPIKTGEDAVYTFDKWVDADGNAVNFSSVNNSISLYPQFTSIYYIYVTFYADDKTTVLYKDKILPGEKTVFEGDTPTKVSEEFYYEFSGWLDASGNRFDLNTLNNSSIDLYPEFKATRYIYVNFYADNKTDILSTVKLLPNQSAVYSGVAPTKDSDYGDVCIVYTFAGWVDAAGNSYSNTIPVVSDSIDLYATFTATTYVVVKFYDVNGNLINEHVVIPGTPITFDGPNPVKESIPEEDYIFSAWKDENGNGYEFSNPRYNVELYPEYTTISYVVFYDTDGETILQKEQIRPGMPIIFNGALPKKDSGSEEIVYTFVGWETEDGNEFNLSAPESSVRLYPVFEENEYVILDFYNVDGTHLLHIKVPYGQLYSYTGIIPTKNPEGEVEYEFNYWQDETGNKYDLSAVEFSAKLYPVFREIRYVNINFYDTDGNLLGTQEDVRVGTAIIFDGDLPTKESTDENDYTFAAWMDIDGNRHYTVPETDVDLYPSFDVTRYVVIKFFAADHVTVLYEQRVLPGSVVTFEGSNPEKEPLDLESYYFAGWVQADGTSVGATLMSDVSLNIYPTYTTITYVRVNFYNYDGTIFHTEKVRVGNPVAYTETPTRPSTAEIDYAFSGWVDENGDAADFSAINSSVDFYPTFSTTNYALVKFYNVDNQLIWQDRILLGGNATFGSTLPVKPTDDHGVYTFSHWATVDGEAFSLENVGASVDLYPVFDTIPYLDVIFYAFDRVTVLATERVLLGSGVTYTGSTPLRANDELGRYSFSRWVDADGAAYDLSNVGEAVELYPEFTLTPYIVITFVGVDGVTILEVQKTFPGEGPLVYGGSTPFKESIPEADYAFTGKWLDQNGEYFDLSNPLESITVYPEFSEIPYIVINFYAFDGFTILQYLRQRPDQRIVYSGNTPVRDATDLAVYEFTGWAYLDGTAYNFERLSTSADFYPVFREIPYVTITFFDLDGETALSTVKVLQGEEVKYVGNIPVKESDETYAYTFAYWAYADGSRYDFSSDATADVYPVFISAPFVNVTFFDLDGVTVLDTQRIPLGSAVVFAGVLPTLPSDLVYDYFFDAWVDEDGVKYDLTSVAGSVNLYATIRRVLREDYKLEEDETTGLKQYNVNLGDIELIDIPLAEFIEYAASNRSVLNIITEGVSVRFAYSQLSALIRANVASISVYFTPIDNMLRSNAPYLRARTSTVSNGYICYFVLKDAEGNTLDADATATITVDCDDADRAKLYAISYVGSDGEAVTVSKQIDGSAIRFEGRSNVQYTFRIKYDVNVSTGLPIGINVSVDNAAPGEEVTVTLSELLPPGKKLTLYYYDADSVKHVVTGNSFVMPDGDVFIGIELIDIIYTVTFKSEGVVIFEKQYKYGETVLVPGNPVKPTDGTYNYTFIGWSQEIGVVTEDVVYEAQFEATLVPDEVAPAVNYVKILKIVIIVLAINFVLSVVLLIYVTSDKMTLVWKV